MRGLDGHITGQWGEDSIPADATPARIPRRGEHETRTECPNECGAALVYFVQDRLFYCRRCAEEFDPSQIGLF